MVRGRLDRFFDGSGSWIVRGHLAAIFGFACLIGGCGGGGDGDGDGDVVTIGWMTLETDRARISSTRLRRIVCAASSV